MAKMIPVESCGGCPYNEYSDGGGHIEPYNMCSKFRIILGDENTYYKPSIIHPECKLKNLPKEV